MSVSDVRVSVLMPVWNAQATLHDALQSIAGQDMQKWECVVVDDGSDDGSAGIVREFAAADERFRLIEVPHGGIVQALNAGLEACRGEYVARMDADDVSLASRLRLQSDLLDKHPQTGLVGCRVRYGGDAERQAGYHHHVEWLNSVLTADEISLNRFIESPLAHPSVMFRRRLVDAFGGYAQGNFPEDYELWLRWMDAGVRMEKVDAEGLIWNDPPQRLSRTDGRYSDAAFYRIKAKYLSRWIHRNQISAPREIWVCGAGRLTRRRVELLQEEGTHITGFVDIDPRKQQMGAGGLPVRDIQRLGGRDSVFVLSYVANRGAREWIREHLQSQGRREGEDFLLV